MVSKADYLDYMQGSGYLTSPIFQQGFEKWDPESLESAQLKQKFNSPLNKLLNAQGMAGSDTGLYVPEPSERQIESEFYGPFQDTMGHETSHLGFDYDNRFRKGLAEAYGGINPLGEENWNYMHDLMYGNDYNTFQRNKLMNRGLMSLPTPVFGGRFGRRIGYTPGGWNPNTYNKIRSSGLVPWQQGVLMQGPTTAAGQVALNAQVKKGPMRQTPEQVKAQGQAYMDPNRGNVQAPTMTYEEIKKEADRTGGTRHAGEMTKAAGQGGGGQGGGGQGGGGGGQAAGQRPSRTSRPSGYAAVRKYGRADGGMVGMDYLTRRL